MKTDTICVHGIKNNDNNTGAIAVPIYQSSTFVHPGFGQDTGYSYSRLQNPTREHAEKLIAALENGAIGLAFSSGMAAISTITELFSGGDEIIASDDLYGGAIRLFNTISRKNGVNVRYADTTDLSAVEAQITADTKAIFIETPTNPMMKVTDISAVKKLIGGRDILLIVDNTFLTPYLCRPLDLGADIVIHSGTKYLSGHNDTLSGFIVTNSEDIGNRLKILHKTTGAILSPFDAFLVIRGVKTLAIRMVKAQANACEIAAWLKTQPKVTQVYYPGIGAMISFTVDSAETARNILNNTNLILFAESLGGTESLITYPVSQTHADVPEAERLSRGIDDKLLRISVGIENAGDLIEDLECAFR
ncbi:MAG: PLP-dependent aspartate aminotransferase family protein [Lachnospiraceae bacterium]|nr:PLP-dependent aspartate aminotransferase family protein [Lachnospiraceae bacterium]